MIHLTQESDLKRNPLRRSIGFRQISYLLLLSPLLGPPAKADPSGQTLWSSWYTVKVGKTPYQSYQETLERKNGKIKYLYQAKKREEGHLDEEQLGTLSEDLPTLRPVLYNFRSTYRKTEKTIDGTIADGVITAKLRTATEQLNGRKRNLPKEAFFASLFPLWVNEKIKIQKPKPGKLIPFTTVVEDTIESGIVETGRATIEKEDAIAVKTQSQKLKVQFRGIEAFWWIASNGMPRRIEIPDQKTVIEAVSEETAKSFLTER
jgi:hypothetical protein